MSKAMKTLLFVFLAQMLTGKADIAAPSEGKADMSSKEILDKAAEIAQESENLLKEEEGAKGDDESALDEEGSEEGDEENEDEEGDEENEDEEDDEERDDEDGEEYEDGDEPELMTEGNNETITADEGAEEGEDQEGEEGEEGEEDDEGREYEDEEDDEDDSGFASFLQTMEEKRHVNMEAAEQIADLYKMFDADKDEQMSWTELMQVFEPAKEDSKSATEEPKAPKVPQGFEEAFNEADANQNKLLCKDEIEKFAELLETKKVNFEDGDEPEDEDEDEDEGPKGGLDAAGSEEEAEGKQGKR